VSVLTLVCSLVSVLTVVGRVVVSVLTVAGRPVVSVLTVVCRFVSVLSVV
jgi:hypothetical protein